MTTANAAEHLETAAATLMQAVRAARSGQKEEALQGLSEARASIDEAEEELS